MGKPNTRQESESEERVDREQQPPFTIVGMGASAGGLEALQNFFDHTSPDINMTFVVVMHLSPEHPSHLAELLQVHTKMPVTQVSQTLKMEPNHVYVIPPNCNLTAIDTHLRLSELEESRRQRAPIDYFFRTLAKAHREQAIGIILSGTGSDGSLGLKQIKEVGGLTVVQDPQEAQYDSMPQNALATGLIDLILPVSEMAQQIKDFVRMGPKSLNVKQQHPLTQSEEDLLYKIFVQLRTHVGHDFSTYKRSTIMRRIQRRMQLQQIEKLGDYLQVLRENQSETEALFHDLLITVTNFFRDEAAFAELETKVIPGLFVGKSRQDSIRVWVAGCATGEEAYSIAMLLLENCRHLAHAPEVQVFASDVSEPALTRARNGIYPMTISADVSPERLERFFFKEGESYRIKQEVRDVVLFANHNLLSDPPFSKQDLISCRNLLIYLQREVQDKITEIFHYALKPNGFLFLGNSESINSTTLFRPLNKKQGLYQGQAPTLGRSHSPLLPMALRSLSIQKEQVAEQPEQTWHESIGSLHQQMVERYVSPSLLLDEDFNIVHLSQNVGRYLLLQAGEPTNSVLQCIRPELHTELMGLLHGVSEKNRSSSSKPVSIPLDGEKRLVTMRVYSDKASKMQGHLLLVFTETENTKVETTSDEAEEASTATVRELKAELSHKKERLQTAMEEFKSSREEMRAVNEELQSMNEELRSTAEELETSKEELQSMNEELLAVNQQNKNKVAELSQLSDDLQNLLDSTDIATLFLDRDLRIRRFTPRVDDLFNIIDADLGRPLAHITHKLQSNTLLTDANQVLEQLVTIEREIYGQNGRTYLVRLRPYRSMEDRIEGVVITLVDISKMKQMEEELRTSKEFNEYIVSTIREGLLVLDSDLRVTFANQFFYELFEVTPNTTLGSVIYQVGDDGEWEIPELRTLLEDVLPNHKIFHDYEVAHEFHNLGRRIMRVNGRQIEGQKGILLAIKDITGRHETLDQLKNLTATLEEKVANRTRKVSVLAAELLVAEQKVRQHLARILHDNLQQILFSMPMRLQVVTRKLTTDGYTELADQFAELQEMMTSALTVTREMASELSPPLPQGADFGQSIRELAAQVSMLHQLKINVSVNDFIPSPNDEISLVLLHIVQELLFNVVKHADVETAEIEVIKQAEELTITVIDEGIGFDVSTLLQQPLGTGLGLYSIEKRLSLLGGRLEIDSNLGEGMRVTMTMPTDTVFQRTTSDSIDIFEE